MISPPVPPDHDLPGRGEELRLLQLDFTGEVLGAYVHEANNRLATLQETVGLFGDLLRAAGTGRAEGVKESLRIAAGLERQITLFAALNRNLDGFARSLRSPQGGIELPRALEELLSLTARLARQKKIRIERVVPRPVPPLRLEPATFLLLIHHLVSRGCELLPPQATLRLNLLRERGATVIDLESTDFAGSESVLDDRARGLAQLLGARLEELQGGAHIRIWFPNST